MPGTAPERAVGLYETFIAACSEKADEVDDSSGYFGTFGGRLFSRDCLAMATILTAKDGPTAALTWVERGLRIESSYDLRAKQRELLTALGRRDEAIQREWSRFTQVPAIYSYQALMELVPGTERASWHGRRWRRPFSQTPRYRFCSRS